MLRPDPIRNDDENYNALSSPYSIQKMTSNENFSLPKKDTRNQGVVVPSETQFDLEYSRSLSNSNTTSGKRRHQQQFQQSFSGSGSAPMTLENSRQCFQYLFEKGISNGQLSLRETARIDVNNQHFNVFKEWAPIHEIKILLQDMIDCRTGLLER